MALKKYTKAEKYLLKGLKLNKASGLLEGELQAESSLSSLYAETKRHELALEHYKNAMNIKDTLFNQEKNTEITRKEMSYDFEKKEAVADAVHKAELKNQNVISEEKSRKQSIITWTVVFGLLLVLVFAGYIFRTLKITRKQKRIIELQKIEVENQKLKVEEHQKEMIDSITYARRIQRSLLPSEKYIEKTMVRLKKNE